MGKSLLLSTRDKVETQFLVIKTQRVYMPNHVTLLFDVELSDVEFQNELSMCTWMRVHAQLSSHL